MPDPVTWEIQTEATGPGDGGSAGRPAPHPGNSPFKWKGQRWQERGGSAPLKGVRIPRMEPESRDPAHAGLLHQQLGQA